MSAVRLELFGRVAAWDGPAEVPLGPARQRAVLGLIALGGGRPVRVAELVDTLWPADPPRCARNVVHTYVRRLRRALEPDRVRWTPSAVLPSVPGTDAYALGLGDRDVDVWLFRHLVREARAARTAGPGDPGRVLELCARALDLCRAPVLAELAHCPAVAGLDADRQLVLGWYAAAAIAAGTPGEALALVERDARDRPLDEGAQARLIGVLHALGQRAAGVAVYRRARVALRRELGVAPGDLLEDARLLLTRC
ncbi:BTAD domain-containing putative transcriptional regulator [Longispora sp. NPDC051575]|uniref:AfsR/SARP family transcriptional regulator n=1 Tax=Longispora sp. NPDC051575 TaxID=3154943 RepID=UPI0034129C75